MKKAELVAEAKKRYPVGTVFLDAFDEKEYTLREFSDYEGSNGWYDDNHIIVYVEGIDGYGKYLYRDGKWADILQAMEFILPNNWCLDLDKLNESDKQIVKQYWEELPNLDNDITFKGYLLSDAFDGTYMHWGNAEEYEKISFETFKDFVLVKDKILPCFPVVEEVVNQFPIY